MAVKKLRLDGIGNYAEDVIEEVVDFGAANLLTKLKGQDVPIREGIMRNRWKIRKVSNLESDLINNLEYAEPVTFGTNLPPTWKNGSAYSKLFIRSDSKFDTFLIFHVFLIMPSSIGTF